jgi:hypothetical protein
MIGLTLTMVILGYFLHNRMQTEAAVTDKRR